MKHIILSMIAAITLQAQAKPTSQYNLVDDPCAGAIQCSPGNDGDMSQVEVKKIYTCVLYISNTENPLLTQTLAIKKVQTSGEGKFTSTSFNSGKILVTIDTNYAAIRRVTITHSGLKTQAFVDDSNKDFLSGPGNTANLIDIEANELYSAHCFTPLK